MSAVEPEQHHQLVLIQPDTERERAVLLFVVGSRVRMLRLDRAWNGRVASVRKSGTVEVSGRHWTFVMEGVEAHFVYVSDAPVPHWEAFPVDVHEGLLSTAPLAYADKFSRDIGLPPSWRFLVNWLAFPILALLYHSVVGVMALLCGQEEGWLRAGLNWSGRVVRRAWGPDSRTCLYIVGDTSVMSPREW